MSVTTSNLAMGPGVLYIAAFGATEPAATAGGIGGAPSNVDWSDLGGTMGGITMTVSQTFKELEVDQLVEVPERRVTAREVSIKTVLAEATMENLKEALNSGTITTGTGYKSFEPDASNSGTTPNYRALIFDGFGGAGLRRRVIARKVLSTDSVDVVASKDGQTGYAATFSTHYVSSSIKSYSIYQLTA